MDATPRSPAATEHASAEVLAIATEYGGPPRKAAFSMLEAARRYCDHLQWQAACDVLLVAAAQLQLHPLQWLHHSDTRPKAETSGGNIATDLGDLAVCGGEGVEDNARGARSHGGLALRMVGSSSRGWPRLRKTVLAMLLEVAEAMDDTTLYTSLALFTLRLFESALPEDAQRQLFRQLEQRATRLSPPMDAPAIGLPWLLSLRAEPLPPERLPHPPRLSSRSGVQSTPTVFTFSPFESRRRREAEQREKSKLRWVRGGEAVTAVATLANPLCMPIRVDLLALHATVELCDDDDDQEEDVKSDTARSGGDGDTCFSSSSSRRSCATAVAAAVATFVPSPVSLTLPPLCRGLEVELSGRIEGGESNRAMVLRLGGVEAHAFGAACVHPVDSNGQATLLPATAFATPPWWRPAPRMHNVGRAFADALDSDDARVSAHAQSWKPPPPQRIPLAPPMPLLVLEPSRGGGGGNVSFQPLPLLHPGQTRAVTLRLTNRSEIAVCDARVTLQQQEGRLLSAHFHWYEVEPHALYDESECEGARLLTRFALDSTALAAQLPLRPRSASLCIPIRVTATTHGTASCNVELSYAAGSECICSSERDDICNGSGEVNHDDDDDGRLCMARLNKKGGARAVAGGGWSRKLLLPIRLPVAAGLTLSPGAAVLTDPQLLLALSTRPQARWDHSSAARKHCQAGGGAGDGMDGTGGVRLLMLHVENQHESATFELNAEITKLLSPFSAEACGAEYHAPERFSWRIPPSSSQQLLLPLRSFDVLTTPHPLPKSLAMLESYLVQHVTPITEARAEALRHAHLVKSLLLAHIRLRWQRLVGHDDDDDTAADQVTGTMPLGQMRLQDAQLAALCRPPVALRAQLSVPDRAPTGAHAAAAAASPTIADRHTNEWPHLRTLTIHSTNVAWVTPIAARCGALRLRVRGSVRGSVHGSVRGSVRESVRGSVRNDLRGPADALQATTVPPCRGHAGARERDVERSPDGLVAEQTPTPPASTLAPPPAAKVMKGMPFHRWAQPRRRAPCWKHAVTVSEAVSQTLVPGGSTAANQEDTIEAAIRSGCSEDDAIGADDPTGTIIWVGALDVLLDDLDAGNTREHTVTVCCARADSYRFTADVTSGTDLIVQTSVA